MGRWAAIVVLAATLGCGGGGGAADAGAAGCPPPAPWGYEVGDRVADLGLTDGDGNPAGLHALCGRVGLVAAFYGWCASCPHYAQLVDALAREHGDAVRPLVVVVEDAAHTPATPAYCAEVRDYLGLEATVACDPGHAIEAYGAQDLVMVIDRGGLLRYARLGPDESALRGVVEAALAE